MSGYQPDGHGRIEIKVARRPRLRAWITRHAAVLLGTVGASSRTPLVTLMTALVLGVSLALPAGLFVLLANIEQVGVGWDGSAEISAFLKPEITDELAERLAGQYRADPRIVGVSVITHEQALNEYQRLSGLGNVLDVFRDENPLPAVLVITPDAGYAQPAAIAGLVNDLRGDEHIEFAQFDLQWLQRLYAILDLLGRAVWVLAGMLALGVVLVIGNTIRLEIENRRAEIEVIKLIGGTDAFIRRPFLYSGLWYGALGALAAAAFIALGLGMLAGPVHEVSRLYFSQFELSGLSFAWLLGLLVVGAGLGLAGAWLAVGRHLREIEPS